MSKIIELLNDFLVLRAYDQEAKTYVWNELVEATREDLESANKLAMYANDFDTYKHELSRLNIIGVMYVKDIADFLGGVLKYIENNKGEDNE